MSFQYTSKLFEGLSNNLLGWPCQQAGRFHGTGEVAGPCVTIECLMISSVRSFLRLISTKNLCAVWVPALAVKATSQKRTDINCIWNTGTRAD